jgi:branched-chain amino acid transport system permease protein
MWDFILQNLFFGIMIGSLYAIVSMGMTMVYGLLNILHVAHVSIVVLGAYLGMLLYKQTHNIIFSILIVIFVCGVVGALIYLIFYKKILNEKSWVTLLVSVGIFTIFGELFRLIFGPYPISFRPEISFKMLKFSSIEISPVQTFILVSMIAIFVISNYVVNKSKIGLSWKALSQDKIMSNACGINVGRSILYNFIFGSALAGAAGFLVAAYYGNINPTMGDIWIPKIFAIMVLGGLGSIGGTILASYILGIGEVFIIASVGYFLPKDSIAFILTIFVLLFVPYGISEGFKRL